MIPHLDDLASDFSVFHRVDDITALPGPVFFRLAWRLPAYQGVMQARQIAAARRDGTAPAAPAAAPRSAAPAPRGVVTAATVDPVMKGIFSFG